MSFIFLYNDICKIPRDSKFMRIIRFQLWAKLFLLKLKINQVEIFLISTHVYA